MCPLLYENPQISPDLVAELNNGTIIRRVNLVRGVQFEEDTRLRFATTKHDSTSEEGTGHDVTFLRNRNNLLPCDISLCIGMITARYQHVPVLNTITSS
jgi:hypothetical protein